MDFCYKLGVHQQEITEEKRHSCNRQIKAEHGPWKWFSCEEGKGSPGVSQGKYFQQESGVCLHAAQLSLPVWKERWVHTAAVTEVMVVTRRRRVRCLERSWAWGLSGLAKEEWEGMWLSAINTAANEQRRKIKMNSFKGYSWKNNWI